MSHPQAHMREPVHYACFRTNLTWAFACELDVPRPYGEVKLLTSKGVLVFGSSRARDQVTCPGCREYLDACEVLHGTRASHGVRHRRWG